MAGAQGYKQIVQEMKNVHPSTIGRVGHEVGPDGFIRVIYDDRIIPDIRENGIDEIRTNENYKHQ